MPEVGPEETPVPATSGISTPAAAPAGDRVDGDNVTRSPTGPDVLGKCPDGTAQEREGLRVLARSAWSRLRVSGFSAGTLVLGLIGSLAVFTGGIGCAGIPVTDPFLGDGTLSVLRYGYGRDVDGLWQTTGSPYGPLFLLLAKGSSRSPGTESSAVSC